MNEILITSKEARRMQNAYMREWRKKNKDKVKEINKRYWEKKAKITDSEEIKQCNYIDRK